MIQRLKKRKLVLRDQSGSIECSFPGQPFLDRTFRRGDIVLVTGPVRFFHGRQIQPREWVILGNGDEGVEAAGKVLPIYPATEGLSQKVVRSIVDQNLDRFLPLLQPEEPFPRAQLEAAGLPTRPGLCCATVSAAASDTTVVVLATPPFWLATA